ncbi:MAG: hypothetical protein LVQ96_06700 [Thermoplasmatales archaeon]|nr:hypothetical protein [Thermoplasmatales archaeon]
MIKPRFANAEGKLTYLEGIEGIISGRKGIRFCFIIDKFNDVNINEVYLISELQPSSIVLTNKRNNKELKLLLSSINSHITVNQSACFDAEISKPELKYISDNLLGSDLQINWDLNWLGFIGYKLNVNPFLAVVDISNMGRADTKVSMSDFNDNVWSKISGEERYLVNIPNVSSSIFLKVPDEVNEWKNMMSDRAGIVEKAMRKFEVAEKPDDFATIARELKAVFDKLKSVTERNKNPLQGLLFNKLFSGSGVNEASDGMMDGLSKVMEGLEKISNQIGHTATTHDKGTIPFNYVGDRESTMTFLFITALLFNFMGKMLK